MPLPVVLSLVIWIAVYGGGCVWLWRTRWTPRRHLAFFVGTLPILVVGLMVYAWGSTEATVFVILSFLLNVGLTVGLIWTGIRQHERHDPMTIEPDADLRWDLKR